MKNLILFALLLYGNIAIARSKADVDTFQIKGVIFSVATPDEWFSLAVKDEFQNDSTWNYKMRYSPLVNSENTVAEIWIRLIHHTDSAGSRRKMERINYNQKITQSSLFDWPCYRIYYTPEPVRGCRKCGSLHTLAYSVPLNREEFLEIVFQAQGRQLLVEPLENIFAQTASDFVRTNFNSLLQFRAINFLSPLLADTFLVSDNYVSFPYPTNFFHGPKNSDWSNYYAPNIPEVMYSYSCTSPDGGFSIGVVGTLDTISNSDSVQKSDTGMTNIIVRDYVGATRNILLRTKRTLTTKSGRYITLSFEMRIPVVDPIWQAYYEKLFLDYINYFKSCNKMICEKGTETRSLPELKPINTNPLKPQSENKLEKGIRKPK